MDDARAGSISDVVATPAAPLSYFRPGVRRRATHNYKRIASISLRYALLIALGVMFAMPFVWMVGTSLTPADLVLNRDRPLFPMTLMWSNYRQALVGVGLPFDLFLKNTLIIAVLCTIGQTL